MQDFWLQINYFLCIKACDRGIVFVVPSWIYLVILSKYLIYRNNRYELIFPAILIFWYIFCDNLGQIPDVYQKSGQIPNYEISRSTLA